MKTFNEVRKEFKRTADVDALVVNCLRVLEVNEESKLALEKAISEREKKTRGIICGTFTNPRFFTFKFKPYTDEDGETYVCEIRELVWAVEFVSGGAVTFEQARKACYRCLYKGKFYGLPLTYATYVMSFEEGRKYGGER